MSLAPNLLPANRTLLFVMAVVVLDAVFAEHMEAVPDSHGFLEDVKADRAL